MGMKDGRVVYLVGAYLLLLTVALVAVPVYVYRFSAINDALIRSLAYVACAGGLGGLVYLIRSFYKHVFRRNFRPEDFWWYLFRPFNSAIMGVMSYFLIVGGLLSIGGATAADYEKSIMLYCGISFLAGFSFTQFADKLEDLAKTVFAKSGGSKK
jgi:hypothetical protein